MKPLLPTRLKLAIALGCLTIALLPLAPTAAAASAEDLEALLSQRYFEVEFFVFERPAVLDFATEEILTLNRPRALPRTMRTQRLVPDALWSEPLDPMTRACLTFPTLEYELLPDTTLFDEPDPGANPAVDPAAAATDAALGELPPTVPTPTVEPILEPNPQLDFLAAMAEFESALEADSQRWQEADRFQLRREANRIESHGLGRILFHGRWLQAVPPREAPDPILVSGGNRLAAAPPLQELVGSVGVTLGRYLHFKADLFFHSPGLGLAPTGAIMDAGGQSLLLGEPDVGADPLTGGYMQLSESRRMRSEELHYLDHPKLGLVVRIDPVTFPESLLMQLEALEALEESTD